MADPPCDCNGVCMICFLPCSTCHIPWHSNCHSKPPVVTLSDSDATISDEVRPPRAPQELVGGSATVDAAEDEVRSDEKLPVRRAPTTVTVALKEEGQHPQKPKEGDVKGKQIVLTYDGAGKINKSFKEVQSNESQRPEKRKGDSDITAAGPIKRMTSSADMDKVLGSAGPKN